MSDGGQRIINGLNDAIAWAKGDESAAQIVRAPVHTPEPENAEDCAATSRKASGLNVRDLMAIANAVIDEASQRQRPMSDKHSISESD